MYTVLLLNGIFFFRARELFQPLDFTIPVVPRRERCFINHVVETPATLFSGITRAHQIARVLDQLICLAEERNTSARARARVISFAPTNCP